MIVSLSEETRQKNLSIWVMGLTSLGVNTDSLVSKYGELIKNAPLNDKATYGLAYEGSLLASNFRMSIVAKNINSTLAEEVRVPVDDITKVALLSNLAKALMLTPTQDDWKKKNGIMWEYTPLEYAFRTGQRTVNLLLENGINLKACEIEALLGFDCMEDNWFKQNASMLTRLMQLASQTVWVENRALQKK
jgi:hypothetical protein